MYYIWRIMHFTPVSTPCLATCPEDKSNHLVIRQRVAVAEVPDRDNGKFIQNLELEATPRSHMNPNKGSKKND